jgi:putative NIF3 family GTP cyclohydrolase 1 type 2
MSLRHQLVQRFINILEGIAPSCLADKSWDNVGLLLESPKVKMVNGKCRVMLTIDLNERVFLEGLREQVSIIMAYHVYLCIRYIYLFTKIFINIATMVW